MRMRRQDGQNAIPCIQCGSRPTIIVRCYFFFSSRRRHTRLQGDWSSDVCSSDLYQTPVALQYDVGDYGACMDKAEALADVAGFAARRADSEARGLRRGLGYSSYIEACGLAPSNIPGALGARAGLFECGERSEEQT